jgi:RNA polymerase sigma-70 factor (ECF subfamily)
LTQQFFALLIERKDFQSVDARKGKFRTFLLTSLTHFLSNQRDYIKAAKRGGGKIIIPLDDLAPEQVRQLDAVSNLPPHELFDLRWALAVLEQGLAQLRQEMREADKVAQFEELKPFLARSPARVNTQLSPRAWGSAVRPSRSECIGCGRDIANWSGPRWPTLCPVQPK